MENVKLKVENCIKKYVSPEAEVVKVMTSDIITTSPGTETPPYEENDGIWELEIKA